MREGQGAPPAGGNGGRGSQRQLLAGRFLVLRQLGQGGMGRVWLAVDETLGRLVAIKELRPVGADARTHQQRALREARSAAVIAHPNAVTLHEVFSVPGDDAVYLVMEYVEGPTLAELIDRHGPLPAPAVARYGLQVLDVLEAAHALGFVHRDVKPGNILIAAGDQAKLADFGIAYNVSDTRLTSSGAVVGTRAYMAPELFDGKPITPAADLWSLGATLYHAAEGRGAFDREASGPMLRAILLDDIPVPRCEPHLAVAIVGLLCRDPRYRATIEETRESLLQVQGQRSGQAARPASRTEPPLASPGAFTGPSQRQNLTNSPGPPSRETLPSPRRPGRRSLAVAAAILVLAAAGTVGGLLASQASTGSPGSTASAVSSTASAVSSTASAVSSTASAVKGIPANGELALRKTILAPAGVAQTGIAYSPDGSLLATYGKDDGSDAFLWDLSTGARTDLPFGTGAVDVAFNAAGTTLAIAERFGGVGLWSIAAHRQTFNETDPYFATGIAFSPRQGKVLAVGDSDGVRLLNLTTRAFSSPLTGSAGVAGPWTVLFSPDGNTLAALDRTTGYVYVWDYGSGALEGTIAPPARGDAPGTGTSIGYTPDSSLLAVGYSVPSSTAPGIRFWGVQKRYVVSGMQYPGVGGVNALAYDPLAADDYAVVGTNGHLVLWEMPSGRKLGDVVNTGGVPFVDVAFSPNGKKIATLDANDRIALWTVK